MLTKEKLIVTAALIWIFVKLPQEYWLHIAEMDTTDWIRANPSNALILVVWAAVMAIMAWWILRDLPPMSSGFSVTAHYAIFKFDGPQASRVIDNYTSERFFLMIF